MADKQSARLIDIQLDNYQLDIERQQPFGKQKTMQSILKPLTSTFKGGELNVIMGPSGCGKVLDFVPNPLGQDANWISLRS